jgi:Zn-finger nucleic acid-binding protein
VSGDEDICPVCSHALHRVTRPFGLLWACPHCAAAYATFPVLRKLLPEDVDIQELHRSASRLPAISLACPFCRHPQVQVALSFDQHEFLPLYCRVCRALRLDRAVLEAIQVRVQSLEDAALRQSEARQKVALLSLIRSLESA